jgi:hypothetical protein
VLTKQQIEDHLITLRVNCDPASPFCGMIDMASPGGLLTETVEDQITVYKALDKDLKTSVDNYMMEAGDECPNCRCGTLEETDEAFVCRGECGEVWSKPFLGSAGPLAVVHRSVDHIRSKQ